MQKDPKDLVVRLVFLESMVAVENQEWWDLLVLEESPEFKDLKERKERMVTSSMLMDRQGHLDYLVRRVEKENVGRKDVSDQSFLAHKDPQEIRERRDVQDAKESLEAKERWDQKDPMETAATVPLLVLLLGIEMQLHL